eukprot:4873891-Amphidinium_carterae.2
MLFVLHVRNHSNTVCMDSSVHATSCLVEGVSMVCEQRTLGCRETPFPSSVQQDPGTLLAGVFSSTHSNGDTDHVTMHDAVQQLLKPTDGFRQCNATTRGNWGNNMSASVGMASRPQRVGHMLSIPGVH